MSATMKEPKKVPTLRFGLHQGNDFYFEVNVPYGKGKALKEAVKNVTGKACLLFNDQFAGRWSLHRAYAPALVDAGVLHTSKDVTKGVLNEIRQHYLDRPLDDAHLYATFERMDLDNFDPKKVPLAHALYQFQNEGVSSLVHSLRTGGAILADDMGLGKTIQSMATALAHGERLVVICPASLTMNWCGEVFKHAPSWSVYVHNQRMGTKSLSNLFGNHHRRFTDIPERADIIISSYESARTFTVDLPEEEQSPEAKVVVAPEWKEIFKDRIAIIDEAHYAKNLPTARTQATLAVCREAKNALPMTGTPILNRPAELWTILLAAGRAHEIAPDWLTFEQWYVKNGQWSELNNKLTNAGWFVRRRIDQVLTELPKKRRGEMLVEMPPALDRAYRNARAGLSRKGVKIANMLAILTELQTIANEAKVAPLLEYLRDRSDQGLKTVVQSTRKIPLQMLAQLLQKEGVTHSLVIGGTPKGDRQHATEAFQRGEIEVFLTTVGEGITLTKADTLVLLDLDWNPGKINQREGRIYRIGQENASVQVFRCVAASIDRHKVDIVCAKQQMIGITIDGGETMDAMDADMQSRVIERLQAENEE